MSFYLADYNNNLILDFKKPYCYQNGTWSTFPNGSGLFVETFNIAIEGQDAAHVAALHSQLIRTLRRAARFAIKTNEQDSIWFYRDDAYPVRGLVMGFDVTAFDNLVADRFTLHGAVGFYTVAITRRGYEDTYFLSKTGANVKALGGTAQLSELTGGNVDGRIASFRMLPYGGAPSNTILDQFWVGIKPLKHGQADHGTFYPRINAADGTSIGPYYVIVPAAGFDTYDSAGRIDFPAGEENMQARVEYRFPTWGAVYGRSPVAEDFNGRYKIILRCTPGGADDSFIRVRMYTALGTSARTYGFIDRHAPVTINTTQYWYQQYYLGDIDINAGRLGSHGSTIGNTGAFLIGLEAERRTAGVASLFIDELYLVPADGYAASTSKKGINLAPVVKTGYIITHETGQKTLWGVASSGEIADTPDFTHQNWALPYQGGLAVFVGDTGENSGARVMTHDDLLRMDWEVARRWDEYGAT